MLTAFLRAALYYLKPLYCVHFVYHVDYRPCKRQAAGNTYVDTHAVVERRPVDMLSLELLEQEQAKRAEIADEVDCDYEETDVSLHLEAGDKTLEEDGLEAQIGYVYAKSLQEEPCRYRHVQRPGFSSEESYRAHADGRHYKD